MFFKKKYFIKKFYVIFQKKEKIKSHNINLIKFQKKKNLFTNKNKNKKSTKKKKSPGGYLMNHKGYPKTKCSESGQFKYDHFALL